VTTAANSTAAGQDGDWYRDNVESQDDANDENPADYGSYRNEYEAVLAMSKSWNSYITPPPRRAVRTTDGRTTQRLLTKEVAATNQSNKVKLLGWGGGSKQ
jgi:hypothetical protein